MNLLPRYRLAFLALIAAATAIISSGCKIAPTQEVSPDTRRDTPTSLPPFICKDCAAPDAFVGREAHWKDLPGWDSEDLGAALPAFRESCRALSRKPAWENVCAIAAMLPDTDQDARQFFEQYFVPRQAVAGNGSVQGLVTGYYEPLIHGSRTQSDRARWPILAPPDDMLTASSAAAYPALRSMNMHGRWAGRKVVTYWTRAELEKRRAEFAVY
jgi:membrane-bound lytic murein transglycosylase A